MPLNETIVDAVGNADFKSVSELHILAAHGHHKRLDLIAETALASALDRLGTTSVPEGLGISAAQRGDLSKTITDLAGAVASIQNMLQAPSTPAPAPKPTG